VTSIFQGSASLGCWDSMITFVQSNDLPRSILAKTVSLNLAKERFASPSSARSRIAACKSTGIPAERTPKVRIACLGNRTSRGSRCPDS
jgi:hypothetical protein